MILEKNGFVIECSGRRVYANKNILGLGPDGVITEGFGGYAEGFNSHVDGLGGWTEDEKYEVAQEMIKRWLAFGVMN